jgi:sigma-B regulation protein RsbU (phosphoserine phosphatase)
MGLADDKLESVHGRKRVKERRETDAIHQGAMMTTRQALVLLGVLCFVCLGLLPVAVMMFFSVTPPARESSPVLLALWLVTAAAGSTVISAVAWRLFARPLCRLQHRLQQGSDERQEQAQDRAAQREREAAEHYQTERQRAHYLSLLKATLEATREGVLAVDKEGQPFFHNERFEKLWSITDADIEAASPGGLFALMASRTASPEHFMKRVRTLSNDPEATSFDVVELVDGHIVELHTQPQRYENVIVGRVWSFCDVTEEQRTEHALRSNNLLLNMLHHAQAQFIADVSMDVLFENLLSDLLALTGSRYGFVAEARYGEHGIYLHAESFTHRIENDAFGEGFEAVVPGPFDIPEGDTLIGRVLRERKARHVADASLEQTGLPKSHPALRSLMVVPFFTGGRIIGAVALGNARDPYAEREVRLLEPILAVCANLLDAHINAHKREEAEKALRQSEERIRAIVDTAGEGIITIDSLGIITSVNRAGAEVFGYRSEELMGASMETLIPEFFRHRPGQPLEHLLKATVRNGPVRNRRFEGRRKDGVPFPMELAISQFQIGENAMFTGIVRDITARLRAEKQLRHRAEFENVIASLSTEFINLPVEEIDAGINRALHVIGEFVGVDRGYLFLYSEDNRSLYSTHEWNREGLPPATPRQDEFHASEFAWAVTHLRSPQPLIVNTPADLPEEAAAERRLMEVQGVQSLVIVPMIAKGRVIGTVAFLAVRESRTWSEETVRLLRLVGELCSNALERKRAEQALAEAREQEVTNAARIQQALLLGAPPRNLRGFDVSALTVPSQRVDGDFYEFHVHSAREVDVLVGDVMGKGIDAALLAAATKAHFMQAMNRLLSQAPACRLPAPAEIITELNSEMSLELANLETFVTLCLARFDLAAHTVRLVDAGHTKTLHFAAKDSTWNELAGPNLPLGVEVSERYEERLYTFAPLDTFVFYSDGVTEARNFNGDFFGWDRLIALLEQNMDQPPAVIAERLRDEVAAFSQFGTQPDDLTVIVLRVGNGPSSEPLAQDTLLLPAEPARLSEIRSFVRAFFENLPGGPPSGNMSTEIELAVVEAATNIMRHAYGDAPGELEITACAFKDRLEISLRDWGRAFVPGPVRLPASIEGHAGGFGLYIISETMDNVEYGQNNDGSNVVTLVKKR